MTMQAIEQVSGVQGKSRPILLAWAVLLMLLLTLLPFLLVHPANGKADHLLAALLMWSMSAAFVRGVGFIPKNLPARYLLGSIAVLVSALAAVLRLAWVY